MNSFVRFETEKARNLESLGVIGGIVIDNVVGSTAEGGHPLFAMSGDGTDDVSIPFVFLFAEEGRKLLRALEKDPDMKLTIQDAKGRENIAKE